jgi:hypothetical protein
VILQAVQVIVLSAQTRASKHVYVFVPLLSANEALVASADARKTSPVIAFIAKELAEPPVLLKSGRRQYHGPYTLVVRLEAGDVKGAPTRAIAAD